MIPLNQSLSGYIIELKVKIKAIKGEMKSALAMGAMEQYRKLNLELADTWDELGRAYQQKGDEKSAKHAFATASTERKKVNQFVADQRTGK